MPIPMRNGRGKRWVEQSLQSSVVLDVVRILRRDARDGCLDRRHWDHKSDYYQKGRSNKQLKIAAAIITGRHDKDMTFDEAWEIMIELAFG